MSEQKLKQLIADKKLICPECRQPVQNYTKYVDMIASVWDGFGDSRLDTQGSKVTLICGSCSWSERSEFWANYIEE